MNPQRWRILAILALVQFTIVTDTTIVNVALPEIARDLGLSESGLTWVVSAYLITAGGLLLLGGRVADLLGRRRTFLLGAVVFGLASAACALSPDGRTLIASRAAQGVGEALASPAALSLIATHFPHGEERAKALGIWGGLAGLGSIAGVTLSGALVTWLGWPAIFWVNVPVVLAAVLLLPLVLGPEGVPRAGAADVPGALLLTAGSLVVLHTLTSVPAAGSSPGGLALGLAVGLALLLGFVLREKVAPRPLVPLSFFRHRTRVVANGLSTLVVGPMAGLFLVLTIYQQNTLGRSALATGLSYLPFCVVFLVGIAGGVALIGRVGERWTVVCAFTLAALGSAVLLATLPTQAFTLGSLPGMVPLGLGLGMAMPALQNAAMTGLSESDAGLGAGVQTAVQSLANAVGVAASMVVLVLAPDAFGPVQGWSEGRVGAAAALGLGGLALALGAVVTWAALRVPPPPVRPAPAPEEPRARQP